MKTLRHAVTGVELEIERGGDETGGELLEMIATYPPGSAPAVPHFHPRQRETFAILEGGMQVAIDGGTRTIGAGETLDIAPGVVHSMWNAGSSPARVRWSVRPALRTEEFFTDVYALAAAGRVDAHGTPGLLDLAILVPRYWDEVRVAKPSPAVQRVVFALLRPLARLLGRGKRPLKPR